MANLFTPSLSPRNIIVRMPNWLGDLVMATPILTDLRHHWPEAKITAMCQGILGTVIQEDPHIDTVFNFKRSKGWLKNQARKDLLNSLKQEHYDLGILLTNSLSSALWFWCGNVHNRIGYATHWRKWLLNYAIDFPAQRDHQHLVITYKMLLEPLGISVSQTPPCLYINPQEQQAAREKLAQHGVEASDLLIGINPGAAYGSAKCWLPERFKQLSQRLLDYPNLKIIFFGDKAGAPLVETICANLPSRVLNLAGKTSLRELIALIQTCHLFLTNDSGPMHVASALGIPLIALFGSTSDTTTGPYQGGRVIHKRVPCSPCYRRECPIDFRCMTRIEVQDVYQEIQNFLIKNSPQSNTLVNEY
jgi:heptosyltransferase-2